MCTRIIKPRYAKSCTLRDKLQQFPGTGSLQPETLMPVSISCPLHPSSSFLSLFLSFFLSVPRRCICAHLLQAPPVEPVGLVAGRTISQIMHVASAVGTYKRQTLLHQFGMVRTGYCKCMRISVLGGDQVMNGTGKTSGLWGVTLSGPSQLLLSVQAHASCIDHHTTTMGSAFRSLN